MSNPYVSLVMFDKNGYPSCEKHGALLCVNKEQSLWRCPTCNIGVSFGSVEALNRWIAAHGNNPFVPVEEARDRVCPERVPDSAYFGKY